MIQYLLRHDILVAFLRDHIVAGEIHSEVHADTGYLAGKRAMPGATVPHHSVARRDVHGYRLRVAFFIA